MISDLYENLVFIILLVYEIKMHGDKNNDLDLTSYLCCIKVKTFICDYIHENKKRI